MSKRINIPTVTDLVVAGDPNLKAQANNKNPNQSHIDELNLRIDELENAIGQDKSGPIGRAYAIRAETSDLNLKDARHRSTPSVNKKNINILKKERS